jgi:hypothetical protein
MEKTIWPGDFIDGLKGIEIDLSDLYGSISPQMLDKYSNNTVNEDYYGVIKISNTE